MAKDSIVKTETKRKTENINGHLCNADRCRFFYYIYIYL